jgi:hypothetical protein
MVEVVEVFVGFGKEGAGGAIGPSSKRWLMVSPRQARQRRGAQTIAEF